MSSESIPIVVKAEDAQLLYELALARAVALEASEEAACQGLGSPRFRRAADVLGRALDEVGVLRVRRGKDRP